MGAPSTRSTKWRPNDFGKRTGFQSQKQKPTRRTRHGRRQNRPGRKKANSTTEMNPVSGLKKTNSGSGLFFFTLNWQKKAKNKSWGRLVFHRSGFSVQFRAGRRDTRQHLETEGVVWRRWRRRREGGHGGGVHGGMQGQGD